MDTGTAPMKKRALRPEELIPNPSGNDQGPQSIFPRPALRVVAYGECTDPAGDLGGGFLQHGKPGALIVGASTSLRQDLPDHSGLPGLPLLRGHLRSAQ